MTKKSWPSWWDWDFEFTPHLLKRMDERGFTESDLRKMFENAKSVRDDVVIGRFLVKTWIGNQPWEVIVEPELAEKLLVIITAYPVWRQFR